MGARAERGDGPKSESESTPELQEVLSSRLIAMEATVALTPGMQEVSWVDITDEQSDPPSRTRRIRVTLPDGMDPDDFTRAVDHAKWVLGLKTLLKDRIFLGEPPDVTRTNGYRDRYSTALNKEAAKVEKPKWPVMRPVPGRFRGGSRRR